jgi:putative methyltransferase (TIGR04325 family)
MAMSSRLSFLRALLPGRVRRVLRRIGRAPLYRGDYASWTEARRASRGYDDAAIINKVIAAARDVRDGRAAWERDTVLFQEPMANEPLLKALRHVATANAGRLNLVDFGGALGSTWWQHRPWLGDLEEVRWSVIEQPPLVAAGQREFTISPVRFYGSLDECCASERPTAILLSSVLPYLENPHALLAAIRARPFRHVIIDRTGFVTRGRDRLTVQRVPASIYDASYPCWFFDRANLLASLGGDWRVVEEWITEDEADIDAEHRGLLLERTAS